MARRTARRTLLVMPNESKFRHHSIMYHYPRYFRRGAAGDPDPLLGRPADQHQQTVEGRKVVSDRRTSEDYDVRRLICY